jgi:hypothetical protein
MGLMLELAQNLGISSLSQLFDMPAAEVALWQAYFYHKKGIPIGDNEKIADLAEEMRQREAEVEREKAAQRKQKLLDSMTWS